MIQSPLSIRRIAKAHFYALSQPERFAVCSHLALIASLGVRQITYVSVPITGGRRSYDLLRRVREQGTLDVGLEELHRREVLQPNMADAERLSELVRSAIPGRTVLNPAVFHAEGWTQRLYNALWAEVIAKHAQMVVLARDWAFSNGARMEAYVALSLGISAQEFDGQALTEDLFNTRVSAAVAELRQWGFTDHEAARLGVVEVPEGII